MLSLSARGAGGVTLRATLALPGEPACQMKAENEAGTSENLRHDI